MVDELRLAVKIGGSISITENGPSAEYAKAFRSAVQAISVERLVVGIGGGRLARNYLKSVEGILSPEESEKVVIQLLRANTQFMALVLGGVPVLDEESLNAVPDRTQSRTLVIGGLRPGRSTDANTALLAEVVGADLFIKMTDVDGVYTSDPHRDPQAQLIPRISYPEILSSSVEGRPGSYGILDRLAIQVLMRARIPARVIDGRDPGNLVKATSGSHIGTEITP